MDKKMNVQNKAISELLVLANGDKELIHKASVKIDGVRYVSRTLLIKLIKEKNAGK